VEKRDTFSFGAHAWRFVDEANSRTAAPLECVVEVVHGKADMMNTRPTLGDELANR
jgi:hypothetical protein